MNEQIVNISVSSTVREVAVVVVPSVTQTILLDVHEADGTPGLSAYQIAKLYGYQGTQAEWNARQNDVLTIAARLATWAQKPLKYYNGAIWASKPLKVYTGTEWIVIN